MYVKPVWLKTRIKHYHALQRNECVDKKLRPTDCLSQGTYFTPVDSFAIISKGIIPKYAEKCCNFYIRDRRFMKNSQDLKFLFTNI